MTEFNFNEGDDKYIADVFGPDGFLSKRIDGYKPRIGQIELAWAIHKGIVEGKHVIGEGPTGTGKSLAYSVPAAYHASKFGKKILIVTANKALQEQIFRKDLLELQEAVPWKFKFAVRKGISNYLCIRDFDSGLYRDLLDDNLKISEVEMVERVAEWARTTKTGDCEDVPGGAVPWAWKEFSTDRDNCDGRKCDSYEECHVFKAKALCDEADIVITNYKLFYLQLAMEAKGQPGRILPIWDVAILDEAHKAADHAREEFGAEVAFGSIYRCLTTIHLCPVRGFKKRGEVLRSDVISESHALWGKLAWMARNKKSILEPGNVDSLKLEDLMYKCFEFYRQAAGALGGVTDAKTGIALQRSNDAKNYLNMADKCEEVQKKLFFFRHQERDDIVYYIDGSGEEARKGEKKRWVKLKSKAIYVGNYMKKHLFEPNHCVVQTSATLAIMGGKGNGFSFLKREMGMTDIKDIVEITVPSPFDWPKQALLVIPDNIPPYKYEDKEWERAVFLGFEKAIRASEGRTLGLFTSRRMMDMTVRHLRSRRLPYEILVQYESTVRDLKDKFQKDESSVLLGLASFSEGFDVKGDACVSVIIEKIPFVNANDAIVQGIQRKNGDWWNGYMLPKGIVDFKQRVGRLIRTETDAGVIVVLDNRLHTKGYRKQFTKSIPPLRVSSSIDDIAPFLKSVGRL
jgi:ATP-dependent DNA helicase DinG